MSDARYEYWVIIPFIRAEMAQKALTKIDFEGFVVKKNKGEYKYHKYKIYNRLKILWFDNFTYFIFKFFFIHIF